MKKELTFNKKSLVLTLLSDADNSVFNEIFTEREYSLLDPIIQKATSGIIDIGAHIGLFSIYARTLNQNVPIFAFEPEPENYKLLKENLKQNRVQGITAKSLAVSAKIGSITLNISPDSHNHSIILPSPSEKILQVQSTTLERTLSQYFQNQQRCDLIKMDCEGAEFEIIATTPPETFAKINAFYIEYHEYTPEMRKDSIKSTLQKHGFKTQIHQSHYDRRMGFILAVRQ